MYTQCPNDSIITLRDVLWVMFQGKRDRTELFIEYLHMFSHLIFSKTLRCQLHLDKLLGIRKQLY